MSRKKAIGIDLGTSKCCVGIFRNSEVEILVNERGNRTTPSYVAFTDTERLIGENAKNQATLNPANTVFNLKRIIGREFKNGVLGEGLDKMPYTIINNSKQETCIQVSYKKKEEFLLPQQIIAMLLGKMKDLAEHHLGSSVEQAVISVPASFSNAQRQATKDAAKIAGLKVLALINEPTAAAIAYQDNRTKIDKETVENVAVVDFGAGNLDVAIVTVCKDMITVRAVHGSTAIGGDDIDVVLMECVRREYKDKGQELLESPAMTERLRSSCEKLKRKLSLAPIVHDKLDCFDGDNVLPVTINRGDFKNLIIPLEIQSSLKKCLDRVMTASRIPRKKISRVILVGGSSRIPLFQEWLEDLFSKDLFHKSVNPDEAIAYGATLCAALLSGDHELEEFKLTDSFPDDYCFSAEESLPVQYVMDQQTGKTLSQKPMYSFKPLFPVDENGYWKGWDLFEERPGQKGDSRHIGKLYLNNKCQQATTILSGKPFTVDFSGASNDVVQVETLNVPSKMLKNYSATHNEDEFQKFVERERLFKKDEENERERLEAMSKLEALSFNPHSLMGYIKAKELFPETVKKISEEANRNLQWLDVNNTAPKEKYVKRLDKLEKLKNHLEFQIKRHEMEENPRIPAATNSEVYSIHHNTSVATGIDDETKLVPSLGEPLEEDTERQKSFE